MCDSILRNACVWGGRQRVLEVWLAEAEVRKLLSQGSRLSIEQSLWKWWDLEESFLGDLIQHGVLCREQPSIGCPCAKDIRAWQMRNHCLESCRDKKIFEFYIKASSQTGERQSYRDWSYCRERWREVKNQRGVRHPSYWLLLWAKWTCLHREFNETKHYRFSEVSKNGTLGLAPTVG